MFVEWGASVQLETGGYLPLQPVPEREAVAENVRAVDGRRKKQPEQGRESEERERE